MSEQTNLFDRSGTTSLPRTLPDHDGATYDRERDKVRLNAQQRRIFDVMSCGYWYKLHEIAAQTNDPEASVSARLRDLRKAKFGGHEIERRYVGDGLWEYRMIVEADDE